MTAAPTRSAKFILALNLRGLIGWKIRGIWLPCFAFGVTERADLRFRSAKTGPPGSAPNTELEYRSRKSEAGRQGAEPSGFFLFRPPISVLGPLSPEKGASVFF